MLCQRRRCQTCPETKSLDHQGKKNGAEKIQPHFHFPGITLCRFLYHRRMASYKVSSGSLHPYILVKNLREAENLILKLLQHEVFNEEIKLFRYWQ